jgi:hypothetical protein
VRHIFISLLFILCATAHASAQDVSEVEIQVERLRAHLREVVDREAQLHSLMHLRTG